MQANETFPCASPFGCPDQPTRRTLFHVVMSVAAARTSTQRAPTAVSSLVAILFQNLRKRFFIMDLHSLRVAAQCFDLKEFVKRWHLKAGLVMRSPELRIPA